MPESNTSEVQVQFNKSNTTQTVYCPVSDNGTFTASLKPNESGLWNITAISPESQTTWRCDSEELLVTVNEPPIYVKYSMFIVAGLIAAIAVGGVVYFLKFRGR
jgi:hypothetical protein